MKLYKCNKCNGNCITNDINEINGNYDSFCPHEFKTIELFSIPEIRQKLSGNLQVSMLNEVMRILGE